MNYTLELDTPEESALAFKNIIFDGFKINVIERYSSSRNSRITYSHIIIKLTTLDDQIIKTKNETVSKKLKQEDFQTYGRLSQTLSSWKSKNDKIYFKKAENDFVQYIVLMALDNYDFSKI